MDKVFDLDLALTVVGISGGDTAESPAPRCFTPPDDHDVSIQVFKQVLMIMAKKCLVVMFFMQIVSPNGSPFVILALFAVIKSPPLDGGADSEVKFDQLDF
ncbi:hypothetical protein KY284_012620 [Solanum tuberosum]|nr:hypothetical protein KY284_012620 [Solanum tuberosum]